MKKRMLVIVNPFSGVGRQRRIETLLQSHLNHDLYDYEVCYTEYIHHGTLIAREAAEKGFDIVTAVGGDGSVNDIVQGLKGSDTSLGIVPCGSGNGLARCLHIPLTPAFAIRLLNRGTVHPIDTIVLNDKYLIASIAGVGFDAYVARLMKAAKMRGFPAYLSLVVREYRSYQSKEYNIFLDGKEIPIERKAWFITFANSNQFGYNVNVAPHAKLDDGLIDISIVDKIPVEHALITAPLVYTNLFELSQHVEMFRAHEITITGNVDKWVNIDGEGENVGKELHFVNHPRSLKVMGK